jgi:hypothetical protein
LLLLPDPDKPDPDFAYCIDFTRLSFGYGTFGISIFRLNVVRLSNEEVFFRFRFLLPYFPDTYTYFTFYFGSSDSEFSEIELSDSIITFYTVIKVLCPTYFVYSAYLLG